MSVSRGASVPGLLAQLKHMSIDTALQGIPASCNIYFASAPLFSLAQRTISLSEISRVVVFGPTPRQFPAGVDIIVLPRAYHPAEVNRYAAELDIIADANKSVSSMVGSLFRSALAKERAAQEEIRDLAAVAEVVTPVREQSVDSIREAARERRLAARAAAAERRNSEAIDQMLSSSASRRVKRSSAPKSLNESLRGKRRLFIVADE
jgi:hypothetical protein